MTTDTINYTHWIYSNDLGKIAQFIAALPEFTHVTVFSPTEDRAEYLVWVQRTIPEDNDWHTDMKAVAEDAGVTYDYGEAGTMVVVPDYVIEHYKSLRDDAKAAN